MFTEILNPDPDTSGSFQDDYVWGGSNYGTGMPVPYMRFSPSPPQVFSPEKTNIRDADVDGGILLR